MAEEGHIPPRNHGQKEASAPMEHGTPSEILPVEMTFNFPHVYLLVFDYFLKHLLVVFWLFLAFWTITSSAQEGAGTFFYSFEFNEGTFKTLLRVLTTKRLLPQSGRTPPRVKNLYRVHKVDGPHQELKIYTKWTDPTKG